jgi:nicotinate-nucleotide--dimethylbenzimidazole phosphoribosyltransferase
MTKNLDDILKSITRVDNNLEPEIRAHLNELTKPPGSLGRLEDIAVCYCLARAQKNPDLPRKAVVTFAADHGVAQSGVSAYPPQVTPQMVFNMLSGGAAVNVLARQMGVRHLVVDVGVNDALDGANGLRRLKIMNGTKNIAQGPAMSVEQAREAISAGIEIANELCDNGFSLIGTGEIGIGNTTSSSALFSALLPCPPEDITGRGTGLDDAGIQRKIDVVRKAVEVNGNHLDEPLHALAALGGLDIAAICGLIIGAASRRAVVIVDGFISSAGAYVACLMCDKIKDYLIYSHCSDEKGHSLFLEKTGVKPLLDLGMRLGEGTGAVLAMPIVESAVRIYNEMATFSSARVSGRA